MSDIREVLKEQWTVTDRAQERVWAAEDKVERLKAQLADAESALAKATRVHEKHVGILQEVWEFVRAELERVPHGEGAEQ